MNTPNDAPIYILVPTEPTDEMRAAAGKAVSGNWRPSDSQKSAAIYKAMIAAAPKSEPTPPPCNSEIFQHGDIVAVMDCGMLAMEGLIKEANRIGPQMDWHYFGGRAVVKTLGDVPTARSALERAMPRFLDGNPAQEGRN